MLIKVNLDLYLHRFNDVVKTDVTVIFIVQVHGESPFERNVI